jgi:hypothetical protein
MRKPPSDAVPRKFHKVDGGMEDSMAKKSIEAAEAKPARKTLGQKTPKKQDKRSLAVDAAPLRRRTQRPFPASAFEDALEFARQLFQVASGQPVRRLTLFDHLGKAPESGPSRMLITNSNRYGLTRGSSASEHLELTEDGLKAWTMHFPRESNGGLEPSWPFSISIHFDYSMSDLPTPGSPLVPYSLMH